MHENRETSSLTARVSGSPAGEGESRTSGTHGSEESDRAVVPTKPSNKATGQTPAAAEMGEGRARTKENVQKARAVPAQDGAAASQGLKGVRKAARERKQERFTTLLHHLTVDLLRDSYHALKRDAAPGVDGVRWAEYEDGLEPRLRDLHERVHRGSYRAQPSRRIYVKKPDGRQRPIGIAALEDKIVQQAAEAQGFRAAIAARLRSKNRFGKYFINFSPAVSDKAVKAIREEIRSWDLHLRSDKRIEDLSRMFNPKIRGRLQYYGRYYRSALYPPMRQLDRSLPAGPSGSTKSCADSCAARHIGSRVSRDAIRSCGRTGRWASGVAPWREPYELSSPGLLTWWWGSSTATRPNGS
jgi:hypothetical protein